MTTLQLKTLIDTLINDNTSKEISAQDVRDCLNGVYDTALLNSTPLSAADIAKLANITITNPVDLDALVSGLAGKVDKLSGMGLSQEDFTTTLLDKLTNSTSFSADDIEEMIREFSTIVEYDLVDQKKPTTAEALIVFKMLPNFDWSKNDTFYIRDTGGANKVCYLVYVADGAVDEATAGPFFIKDMNQTQ